MKRSTVLILLVVNASCYVCYNTLAYMHFVYYNAMQEALAVTNTQLGLIGTAIGFSAIASYFVGGAISDAFSTKKLLVYNALFQAVLLCYFTTYPSYGIIIIIMILAAFTENAIFWNAVGKLFRSQSKDSADEAKMYGYYWGIAGVAGAIFGLTGSYFINVMGSSDGLAWTLRMLAVFMVVSAAVNLALYKEAAPQATTAEEKQALEDEKFKFSYFNTIMKDPAFWLVCVAGYSVYALSASLSYFAPLLHANYGIGLGVVSAVGILRMYVFRAIFAPVGGIIISKVGSLKHMLVLSSVAFVVAVAIAILPMNPSMLAFALVALIVMAICYAMGMPTQYSPLADINVPKKMRGTAIGIYGAFIFSGDTYLYLIGGAILDAYEPEKAYQIMYTGASGIFLTGIIATLILMRLMKKRNAMLQAA